MPQPDDPQHTAPQTSPKKLSPRGRLLLTLAAAAFLAGPFTSHLHKSLRTDHGDWLSIYNVARYSLDTHRLLPEDDAPHHLTLRYPPIARPLLMLLALPPKWLSAILSFVLFSGLYLWSAAHISRIFFGRHRPVVWLSTLVTLALLTPVLWADLVDGNLTSILLASITGAFVLARRDKTLRAGLVLSIGILLKIIPALCLLFFLFRRQSRVAGGTLLGLLLIGVLPTLALFGPQQFADAHRHWIDRELVEFSPMRTIDRPGEVSYMNQSVLRLIVRLFRDVNAGDSHDPFSITLIEIPPGALKIAYVLLMTVPAMGLLWLLWRTRRDDDPLASANAYAVCVGSMLFFSPWLYSYYFALAIWPAAALLDLALNPPTTQARTHRLGLCLLIWFLAMFALASQTLRALSVNLLAATLLTFALALHLSIKSKTSPPQTPRPHDQAH